MINTKNLFSWNSIELGKILNLNIVKYFNFSSLEIDSREVKKDSIFIALQGKKFDGHDFIENAIQQGARGIIISKDIKPNKIGFVPPLPPPVNLLIVF